MLLENLSFEEVEAYLQTRDMVLVPVGSVEQHSPYGLIGTDFITAQHIARKTGERMGVLVAPTVTYGVSPHHMAFKGTVTLCPDTFMAVVDDVTRALAAHGFRRIVWVNGHGGNESPLKTAFSRIKTTLDGVMLYCLNWYELEPVVRLTREYYGEEEGSHATPGEVAVTRYLRPEAFDAKATDPRPVETPDHPWPLGAGEMRRVFPDGRMCSAPWLATARHGEALADTAVKALEEQLRQWQAQQAG